MTSLQLVVGLMQSLQNEFPRHIWEQVDKPTILFITLLIGCIVVGVKVKKNEMFG